MRTSAVEFGASGVTTDAVTPGVVRSPQGLDQATSFGPIGLAVAVALAGILLHLTYKY